MYFWLLYKTSSTTSCNTSPQGNGHCCAKQHPAPEHGFLSKGALPRPAFGTLAMAHVTRRVTSNPKRKMFLRCLRVCTACNITYCLARYISIAA